MKKILILTLLILCAGAILAAGCTTAPAETPKARGDALFSQGETAFNSSNYQTATNLFALAKENYSAAGDHAAYIRARDMAFLSSGAGNNFPYTRSEIEAGMALAFPNVSAAQRAAWLDAPMTATLKSEGQEWYFSETLFNIKNHNPSILQEENARAQYTSGYDELMPLITASWKNGTGTYGAPVAYTGSTELTIPRDALPANGTFKVWMPVPIEYGPQTNVTIISVSPARYVKSSTGTGADIGLVYLEIPLEEITDPFLNISARYNFVQHEQRFNVDPAKVLPYNTSSPEYQNYTVSSKNVVLSP
ncbi:MAG: transglutaminase, partial [Methanoregula sp.]